MPTKESSNINYQTWLLHNQ